MNYDVRLGVYCCQKINAIISTFIEQRGFAVTHINFFQSCNMRGWIKGETKAIGG